MLLFIQQPDTNVLQTNSNPIIKTYKSRFIAYKKKSGFSRNHTKKSILAVQHN